MLVILKVNGCFYFLIINSKYQLYARHCAHSPLLSVLTTSYFLKQFLSWFSWLDFFNCASNTWAHTPYFKKENETQIKINVLFVYLASLSHLPSQSPRGKHFLSFWRIFFLEFPLLFILVMAVLFINHIKCQALK